MTVEKLIEKLQRIEDKSQTVEVSVRQANKIYPVAYCEIFDGNYDNLQSDGNYHRIEIWLPSNDDTMMITSTRKI